jgi:hypothetical protein
MKHRRAEHLTRKGPARSPRWGGFRNRFSTRAGDGPRWYGVLLLLCGSLAAAGCGPAPTIVDGEHAELWVYGEVLNADGTPVREARVRVEARHPEACETPSNVASSTITDAAGRYRTVVGQFGSRFDVCVHVEAIPPEGSGLWPSVASRPDVEMRSVEPDSVRIDIRFSEGS